MGPTDSNPRPEAVKQILRPVAGLLETAEETGGRAIDRPSWAGGRTASLAMERGIPG